MNRKPNNTTFLTVNAAFNTLTTHKPKRIQKLVSEDLPSLRDGDDPEITKKHYGSHWNEKMFTELISRLQNHLRE
jgi:hypothetical protein